jgi:hypothetical protein
MKWVIYSLSFILLLSQGTLSAANGQMGKVGAESVWSGDEAKMMQPEETGK